MQPHDRDDGTRRDRPPGVPTATTADKPALPGDPFRDVDMRVKGPGCWRPIGFGLAGAASGFALAVLGVSACEGATGGSEPGPWMILLGVCCLAVAPIAGGLTGLLLGLPRPKRPPKSPSDD